ncbi:MAG: hypothetical protein FJ267_03455 [Planctomycetes bacterium]|nr:hypothetical protein [Planctomycetota bacterium]
MSLKLLSRLIVLMLAPTFLIVGCKAEAKPFRKKTFKVTGKVTVDGKEPGEPIQIGCTATSEEDKDPKHASLSQATCNPDGTFSFTTYVVGDGVPNGDYVLTFVWGQFSAMSRTYSGDKLKNAYKDPKKSEFKFTVKDQPLEVGPFDLKIPAGGADPTTLTQPSLSASDEENKPVVNRQSERGF